MALWETVAQVALSTAAMYVVILLGVRVAGRRTLAHLSAFDAVVTIALGSVVATTAVSAEVGVIKGGTAVTVLLLLQVVVGFIRRVAPWTRKFLDFQPLVLMSQEQGVAERGLLGPQVTLDELRSALRVKGEFDLSNVAEVTFEPSGEISVRRVEDPGSGPVTEK